MSFKIYSVLIRRVKHKDIKIVNQFSSVTQSCPTLTTPSKQRAKHPCPSPTPGPCSNSCPLSRWCHPTISSSIVPFSPCLQSFPASGFFLWVRSLHQVAKVLELQFHYQSFQRLFRIWFPLGLIGLISLQSKGLSRVFSNTTVQKRQFFGTQHSLWSNSHINTGLLEKPQLWLGGPLLAK